MGRDGGKAAGATGGREMVGCFSATVNVSVSRLSWFVCKRMYLGMLGRHVETVVLEGGMDERVTKQHRSRDGWLAPFLFCFSRVPSSRFLPLVVAACNLFSRGIMDLGEKKKKREKYVVLIFAEYCMYKGKHA